MRIILGEHLWSEVFPQSKDKIGTASCIFYSVFNSRREVEKTGWKPAEIDEVEIFKGFNSARQTVVAQPYPRSEFCLPPQLPGNVSALALFRYLPVELFPEAAKLNPPSETPSTIVAAPRVVPGYVPPAATPTANQGGGGKGRKKGKGKATPVDPTIRPTAPLSRPAEASAKAKLVHNKPTRVMAAMYEDDSDDDGAAYIPGHPGPGPANWEDDFNDLSLQDREKLEKEKECPEPEFDIVAPKVKPKDDEGPLCPEHKKRCKSGICEWAREQKRKQKRIDNLNGPQTGQYQRHW